jgi:hypothetical protein
MESKVVLMETPLSGGAVVSETRNSGVIQPMEHPHLDRLLSGFPIYPEDSTAASGISVYTQRMGVCSRRAS